MELGCKDIVGQKSFVREGLNKYEVLIRCVYPYMGHLTLVSLDSLLIPGILDTLLTLDTLYTFHF